jgi:hypothetical protein
MARDDCSNLKQSFVYKGQFATSEFRSLDNYGLHGRRISPPFAEGEITIFCYRVQTASEVHQTAHQMDTTG